MREGPKAPRKRYKMDTVVIGMRLAPELAAAVKAEAKRRGMLLNELFGEIWDLYRDRKKSGG